ncbi:MAG: nicotinate phosphoribosyltransferase [Gemmatimonadetes bacterium]|nr:nicotinate phosphoribosyltransferase [Gemmatimonadota bacterium]
MPASTVVRLDEPALFTDLYELTMAASYVREGMTAPATFSLFVRRLPPERSFLIAAGLRDALEYLQDFRFSDRALEYLRSLDRFDVDFLSFLHNFWFRGDVWAMPEGTIVFPDEPLLEVTAPLPQAQLVEGALLNLCHFETLVTTKAARCVLAARGRPIVEFGMRRAPGLDGAIRAARCAFIAGAASTSNVLAGFVENIPVTGTMAHSYVSAFTEEIEAFRAFSRSFPDQTVLLLDTYDTLVAAHRAVEVARELESQGHRLAGVRLDSGDIPTLARQVRHILNQAGLEYVRILVSGGLDERDIDQWVRDGVPIDSFGVGTKMDVSADAPYLDMAYKLVRYGERYVLKTSPGKETWTGEKQVYRFRGADGRFCEDLIALRGEPAPPGALALLEPVMQAGRIWRPHPRLGDVRRQCADMLASLPDDVRTLRDPRRYPIRYSERLVELQDSLKAAIPAI